jgi:putative methyltransferase (TIGR04325 family)
MVRNARYGLLDRLDSFVYRRLLPTTVYPTWEAAAQRAGDGYSEKLLNDFRVARRRNTNQQPSSSILLALIRDESRVTDFGGATGDLGDAIIKDHPSVTYTVVETTGLVNLMLNEETKVNFSNEIPSECDIFFSSNTIQYLPNPYDVLSRGFSTAQQYVVLVRNNFSKVERFTIQRSKLFDNGSGELPAGFKNQVIRYPLRSIQEQRVHDIAQACGFVLDSEKLDPTFNYKAGYSKDLVFRRV